MKMDRQVGLAAIDVEKFSKIGTKELKQGRITPAIDAFEYAFRKSKFLDDPLTERSCAFNLGAAYIAGGQFTEGLEVLKYAEPPDGKKDTRSNGDLYFNFGLGLEGMKEYSEAINYYKLAQEEYNQERDNTEMEADAIEKVAKLYKLLGRKEKALATYKELCGMYELMGKKEKQAITLFEQANQCVLQQNLAQGEEFADECLRLLEDCDKNQKIGNMYNDIGLLNTQLQKYEKAATCFEEALPIVRSTDQDMKKEAVVLQNLGAIYNFLGDYQRSVKFHEEAASKYAALQNRKSQGQCFANLAFAFSQLQDTESAGEAFLHALQASRDTDDKRTTWQVLEGLGAVAFNRNDVEKCIRYLKRALGIIATDGSDVHAQERIVGKLTFALQQKLSKFSEPSQTSRHNDSHSQSGRKPRVPTPPINRKKDPPSIPATGRSDRDGAQTSSRPVSRPGDGEPNESKPVVKKLADLPNGEEIVEVEGRVDGKPRILKIRRSDIEHNFTKLCRGLAMSDGSQSGSGSDEESEGSESETESESGSGTELSHSYSSKDSEVEKKRIEDEMKKKKAEREAQLRQEEAHKQRVNNQRIARPMTSKGMGSRINREKSLLDTGDEEPDKRKLQEQYLKFLEKTDDKPPVQKAPEVRQEATDEDSETESGSSYESTETGSSEEESDENENQQQRKPPVPHLSPPNTDYGNRTYEEPVHSRTKGGGHFVRRETSNPDPTYTEIDFERTDRMNLKSRGNDDGYEEVVVSDDTTEQKRRKKFNFISTSEDESEGNTYRKGKGKLHGGGGTAAAQGDIKQDTSENPYDTIENFNRDEHPVLAILPRAEQERFMYQQHKRIQEEKVKQEELTRRPSSDSKTCVVM